MKRTQIILEEWQHETLKTRAEREGKSLSALMREIVTEKLHADSKRALSDICGIASGDAEPLGNEQIDEIIYGDA